jgi:hypothetical protein
VNPEPIRGCQEASVAVNAIAPAGSASTNVISGNVPPTECPVAGVIVMGAYAATPLATNFTAWSVAVPSGVAQAQPLCSGMLSDSGAFGVRTQLIVPGNDGLPVAIDAGCTNAAPTATATGTGP